MLMDGRMDGRTDIQTDRPSYRDARTHLKSWFLPVREPATHNRIICPSFPVYCLRQYPPPPTQRTTPAAVDETPTPESEPTHSSDDHAGGGRRGCGLGPRPRARGFASGWRRRRPGPASILEEPSRWWTKYAVV